MEIYIENVIIDNFIITAILLYATSKLCKASYNKYLFYTSCLISCVGSLIFPLFHISNILLFILKICFGYIICLITFFSKSFKHLLQIYLVFLSLTFASGGLCVAILYTLFGGVDIANYNFPIFVLIIPIYLYIRLLYKIINKKRTINEIKQFMYKCVLKINGKTIILNGFVDSGNSLIDNITYLPIIVVPLDKLRDMFNQSDLINLKLNNIDNVNLKKIHFLRYDTISAKVEKMIVFEPENCMIVSKDKIKKCKCLIGLSKHSFLKRDFDCLLQPLLLKGD